MTKKNDPFEKKIALITGGSSGIGLALAKLLAGTGAHVWLIARDEGKLATALQDVKKSCIDPAQRSGFAAADVADPKQVQKAIDKVMREIGLPDLVINSAGITFPGYVQDIPLDVFHQMIDVDYLGTVHVVQALLPGMVERRSGTIVNISSVAGFMGVFGYSAYGAAKYAVRGYSEVLRAELKPLGIRVSVVFPPDTDTPQLAYENGFKPMETRELAGNAGVMSAEAVGREILKGVARNRFAILPGSEGKLFYRLSGILGGGLYPIMDSMIASAIRKKEKGGRAVPASK